jgi:hypothetical protein
MRDRHALIKMCNAIWAVAESKYKSMTERQLSAYGIGIQLPPQTFAGFRIPIVSNFGAETTDRNEIIHCILSKPTSVAMWEQDQRTASSSKRSRVAEN